MSSGPFWMQVAEIKRSKKGSLGRGPRPGSHQASMPVSWSSQDLSILPPPASGSPCKSGGEAADRSYNLYCSWLQSWETAWPSALSFQDQNAKGRDSTDWPGKPRTG